MGLQDTGGSCSWFDCDPSRGLTYCNNDYKCFCQQGKGLCSINGACGHESNPIPPPAALTEKNLGLEPASSPPAIAAFGAAAAVFLVAGLACRRRRRAATTEPLLS
eukprot:NODE_26067_length_566_cov_1.079727.p1 GENE.NODE_26067_length_566_cov_1.079727~~NODE_26067_length_566_cov_1.079727.p1  ORF type:complete len:106 (+),score=15.36 NODE_26067_length_566_cov_1.079727:3-320(+)